MKAKQLEKMRFPATLTKTAKCPGSAARQEGVSLNDVRVILAPRIARFDPKLVKMAPAGEWPED